MMTFRLPTLLAACFFAVPVFAITDSLPSRELAAGIYATYGNSGYNSYGGNVDLLHHWRIWNTPHLSGTIDGGVLAGYQREPFAQSNSILNGAEASGAAHRIEGLATLGTTVYFPPSHRILFGINIFGGWMQVIMRGALSNPRYNINGDYRADKGVFACGAGANIGVRASDRISIVAKALVPLPYAPAPVTSYLIASGGVAITLRKF